MARVVVVGSVNMDVVARAARLPRPGETLAGTWSGLLPGGKGANQAIAARRLGARTAMVGAVGTDAFGTSLRGFIEAEGVDTMGLESVEGSSGMAVVLVDGTGENAIVVVPGANGELGADRVRRALAGPGRLGAGDVLLLQNEVPEPANLAAAVLAGSAGARVVLNLAPYRPPSPALLAAVGTLVVNQTELAELLRTAGSPPAGATATAQSARQIGRSPGEPGNRDRGTRRIARDRGPGGSRVGTPRIAKRSDGSNELAGAVSDPMGVLISREYATAEGAQPAVSELLADRAGPAAGVGDLVVTLGAAGAVARVKDEVLAVSGHAAQVVDTTGAGDCFCGAFAAALAGGASARDALATANAAAAVSVRRRGAAPSMPTAAEVAALLRPSDHDR